jgi:hypothetical protein
MSLATSRSRGDSLGVVSTRTLRCAVGAAAVALWVGFVASISADVSPRRDLLDLGRLLQFVERLHPTMDKGVRIRSWVGYLDERKAQPYAIDLTLFHEAHPGVSPERIVYGGAARFDSRGFLDLYSGSTAVGDERFSALQKALGQAPLDAEALRNALGAMGAPFASMAPTIKTCPNLGATFDVLGRAVEVSASQVEPLPSDRSASALRRREVAWRIDVVAKRPNGAQRLIVYVDPWGDLLAITPVGQPRR